MKTFSEFNNINENINFTNESKSGLEGVIEYKDGLTEEIVKKKYSWLLKAKFKDAVIGKDKRGLVWYDGVWYDGVWEDGTWRDGEWKSGFWYNGTWENGFWDIGFWYNGTWQDGDWENGIWNYGTWKGGRWKRGEILNQETGEFEESDEPPTI